jgi:hypothetical protein
VGVSNGSTSGRGRAEREARSSRRLTCLFDALLPGGFLPRLVAQMLDDVPGVPRPIPDPLPLTMVRASNDWVATLSIGGSKIRSAGATPADAIGFLLARAEVLYAQRASA